MYNRRLKVLVTEAWRALFNTYPEPQLQGLKVDVEFPVNASHYPGIWVTYEDTAPISIAGVDHKEFVVDATGTHEVTRWLFEGRISMTAVALTPRERDKIIDEMIRSIAFARVEKDAVGTFRDYVENNDLIGININFDEIYSDMESSNFGTPWGTNETIYEKTLSLDIIGEFVSNPATNDLVLLSEVQTQGWVEGEEPPVKFPDETLIGPTTDWNPHTWH